MKILRITALIIAAMTGLGAQAEIVTLNLSFDAYPADISFRLERDGVPVPFDAAASSTEGVPAPGGAGGFSNDLANQSVMFVWNLDVDDYEFIIMDSYGDGLCCIEGAGGYSMSTLRETFQSDGAFASSETLAFSVLPTQVTHSYALNGTLADSVGTLALEGNGGIFAGGRYHFDGNQGLTLRDGLVNVDIYSIEVAMRVDSSFGFFIKLLDFLDQTADDGLYLAGTEFVLYPITSQSTRDVLPGEDFVFVLTQEDDGTTRGYVDGELQFTVEGGTASAPDNVLNILLDDLITEEVETAAGSIDYVRVYDGALTDAQIAALVPPSPQILGDSIFSALTLGDIGTNYWGPSPLTASTVVSPGAEYSDPNVPLFDFTADIEGNRLTLTMDGVINVSATGPKLVFTDLDFESDLVELEVISNTFDGAPLEAVVTSPTSISVTLPTVNLLVGDRLELVLELVTARANDVDGDGVGASLDNCLDVSNADQYDSDGDGFGNACDADLNGDCVANALDLGLLRVAFFSTPAATNWNADADFNHDGVVNAQDLSKLRVLFFAAPGPSSAGVCN